MPTDEIIKTNIVDHLNADLRIDASDIKVSVDDGVATLEGTVPTFTAKNAAMNDAYVIEGVKNVLNNLDVKFAIPPVLPSDEDLEKRISDSLFWNDDVPTDDLEINVENSWVTLEGTVENYWQKVQAETSTLNIRGVVGVTNEIAVVPTDKISDKVIGENVVDAIERNVNVNVDNVNVEVTDGIVELSGKVPDWAAKSAAYDAALYTIGVIDVENNILVG